MTPEERIEKLELEVARLMEVIKIETRQVRITQPLVVNGTIGVNNGAAIIMTGTGSPIGSVAATKGTVYLRTDGSLNSVIYVCYGGTSWDQLS